MLFEYAVQRVYPEKITDRLSKHRPNAISDLADATGSAAAVECGTHVRFEIVARAENGLVSNASFKTNGCGYVIAAADILTEAICGKHVTELQGLNHGELAGLVEAELGPFPAGRAHCLRTSIDAIHAVFSDLRRRRVEEFAGERPLVCTCFSISEETIEELILDHGTATVRAVGEACNAGTGCGSCQPLIRDILDSLGCRWD